MRLVNKGSDEGLDGRQGGFAAERLSMALGRRSGRRGGKVLVDISLLGSGLAANDFRCFARQVGDHLLGDRELDKVVKGSSILLGGGGVGDHLERLCRRLDAEYALQDRKSEVGWR